MSACRRESPPSLRPRMPRLSGVVIVRLPAKGGVYPTAMAGDRSTQSLNLDGGKTRRRINGALHSPRQQQRTRGVLWSLTRAKAEWRTAAVSQRQQTLCLQLSQLAQYRVNMTSNRPTNPSEYQSRHPRAILRLRDTKYRHQLSLNNL